MTHVLCLCPNGHCIADFKVYDGMESQFALPIMKFAINELLALRNPWHTCDKCGASNESWVCKVIATPSQQHEQYDERGLSAVA